MLRSIHLKAFKSFASEQVKFAPLTVMVGANASGKSNLLDAIRLVQGLGLGFSLTDTLQGRTEAGREIWKGIRGGASEAIRKGQEVAELSTEWELQAESVGYFLSFQVRPEPSIQAESQTVAELPRLRQALQRLIALDLKPDRMRSYSPKHAREMGAEGENLSSAIWARSRTEDERLEWVDWLSELCAPEITELDFIETELGDVMLVLVEKDGTRISTRALSDGTLRFLGTLVALKTAPSGSIFLIEELEQGLHPQRIHLLMEFLETITLERGIQVIATTHSPQVLQALSSEALSQAVLCARAQDGSGTVLRRFGDIPRFKQTLAKSGIEHLFTTGWLERAL